MYESFSDEFIIRSHYDALIAVTLCYSLNCMAYKKIRTCYSVNFVFFVYVQLLDMIQIFIQILLSLTDINELTQLN